MRPDSPRVIGPLIRAAAALFIVSLLLLPGCGDEDTGPVPDQVIQIRDTAFLPSSVHVEPGSLVEWQNWSQSARTVTAGDSANDPRAGDLFDETLAGYASGHVIGGTFRFQFDHPDTIRYFSRLAPLGYENALRGTIYIDP